MRRNAIPFPRITTNALRIPHHTSTVPRFCTTTYRKSPCRRTCRNKPSVRSRICTTSGIDLGARRTMSRSQPRAPSLVHDGIEVLDQPSPLDSCRRRKAHPIISSISSHQGHSSLFAHSDSVLSRAKQLLFHSSQEVPCALPSATVHPEILGRPSPL